MPQSEAIVAARKAVESELSKARSTCNSLEKVLASLDYHAGANGLPARRRGRPKGSRNKPKRVAKATTAHRGGKAVLPDRIHSILSKASPRSVKQVASALALYRPGTKVSALVTSVYRIAKTDRRFKLTPQGLGLA